jgi:UDP-N-acetylglucosamine 2-epimerase (non-hydrolysing)
MTSFRVMTVYGTRPEAIKMAPVIRELRSSALFEPVAVVSGQHREMLDPVDRLFALEPDHDLGLFVAGAPLARIFSRVLKRFDALLGADPPDVVVVQGDTSTATAAALAAFYRRIPVVHLEAGLRTGQVTSPFPEELNRRMITQTACLHLAATQGNKENLLRERVEEEAVLVVGNTVVDALRLCLGSPAEPGDPALAALGGPARPLVLVTAHRRENWGAPLVRIGRAVARLAARFPAVQFVAPLHPNPDVRRPLEQQLRDVPNVLITAPLGYLDFTRLLGRARVVLSDSGGVQEEAPSLGVPVVLLRDSTERPEAVDAGAVLLAGTDEDRIVRATTTLLTDADAHAAASSAVSPFGDGHAARRAVAAIAWLVGAGDRPDEFVPAAVAR